MEILAKTEKVAFETKEECLSEFARTWGRNPPRSPIPNWWSEFETWFYEMRTKLELRDKKNDRDTVITLRMSPDSYEQNALDGTVLAGKSAN